jgi:hypothetical protein
LLRGPLGERGLKLLGEKMDNKFWAVVVGILLWVLACVLLICVDFGQMLHR